MKSGLHLFLTKSLIFLVWFKEFVWHISALILWTSHTVILLSLKRLLLKGGKKTIWHNNKLSKAAAQKAIHIINNFTCNGDISQRGSNKKNRMFISEKGWKWQWKTRIWLCLTQINSLAYADLCQICMIWPL